MVSLAMLGLLWAVDTYPDLLSEEPFLYVQKGEKHTQTCEPRISGKHGSSRLKSQFSRICTGVIGVIPSRQTDPSLEFPLSDTISSRLFWFSFHLLESMVCLVSLSSYIHWTWWVFDSNRYLSLQKVLPNFFAHRSQLLVFGTPFSLSMTGLSCCPWDDNWYCIPFFQCEGNYS